MSLTCESKKAAELLGELLALKRQAEKTVNPMAKMKLAEAAVNIAVEVLVIHQAKLEELSGA